MFGISAAYIQASKGVTDPDMRKMIRYCVMDTFIPLVLYRKFYKRVLCVSHETKRKAFQVR